jgi:hypothetical protein
VRKKRLLFTLAGAALAAGLVGPVAAGAASGHAGLPFGRTGVKGLAQRTSHAVAAKPATQAPAAPASPSGPNDPVVGASWDGISDPSVSPPDTNGAIGPNSYVEIINLQIAIYNRTGGLVASAPLSLLTGHGQFNLSDPMDLWDPDTQRFYYNVWDVSQSTMAWGFSKNANPTTIPGSWCNYTSSFGYTTSEFPDYPKLGQTKDFLLIGVNHYPSLSSMHADRTDLLWINKPQGSDPITTCPAASNFNSGKFTNLKNANGSIGFTPVPAIQADPSGIGFVVTEADIECPDICGTGNKITVHAVRNNPNNPGTPQVTVTGKSITVPTFAPPATEAPQKNSSNLLDTLDGRLEHAVSYIDPASGKPMVLTGHNVNSTGNRTEFRWYRINVNNPTGPFLADSGTVSSASLYVFNGAASSDRACDLSGCTHGDSIIIGFSTSSSTTFPADQMVSKIGTGGTSPFVMVHQSTTADDDFTCNPTCRWGDYGGATPDPTKKGGAHGEVWFTNEAVTAGLNDTWNWEASP